MALCPFAVHKLIAPGRNEPRIKARVAVLHVDAGGASTLFSFFKYRSGGIESHFHIRWSGVIEQYRDTGWEADANYRANDFAISIETQGFANGKWTEAQIESIKRLILWMNSTHGIPMEKIKVWNGSGIGYHVQFGAPGPWTPVSKSCPGPKRIKQFNEEIVPWMNSIRDQGEDWLAMASEQDVRRLIREELDRAGAKLAEDIVRTRLSGMPGAPEGRFLGVTLAQIHNRVTELVTLMKKGND